MAALSRDAAFSGRDGSELADTLDELADLPRDDFTLAPADYPDFFRTALRDRVVRRPETPGVRVRIFGPLEARLQNIDRVVLGGLVEGTWPPQTRSDAWLSRPMRQTLGLDLPERRTGLSAHDFAQMLGAREVILTRPGKLAGAPTFPRASCSVSRRWPAKRAGRPPAPADSSISISPDCSMRPRMGSGSERPEPRPPVDARPTSLSVTEIENWLRDPYTIYARHILRLRPLDAVDTPPGARDRGNVIHAAIGEFTQTFAEGLPADPVAELLAIGKKTFRGAR